jgi:hypothetical protein
MAKGGRRSTSWKRGQSGNKGGRPRHPETIAAKKMVADVKAAARELTPQALGTLQEVMEDKKAPPRGPCNCGHRDSGSWLGQAETDHRG